MIGEQISKTKLEVKLPGYEVGITSFSKDETKAVVVTYSDKARGTYYFYDITEDKLTDLGKVSPWLNEDHMAQMKPVKYTSRDGLTIHGYLTLPKGSNGKNLPIVVNPMEVLGPEIVGGIARKFSFWQTEDLEYSK